MIIAIIFLPVKRFCEELTFFFIEPSWFFSGKHFGQRLFSFEKIYLQVAQVVKAIFSQMYKKINYL